MNSAVPITVDEQIESTQEAFEGEPRFATRMFVMTMRLLLVILKDLRL